MEELEAWFVSVFIVLGLIGISFLGWIIKDEYGLAETGVFLGCLAGFVGSVWLIKTILF